MADVNLIGDINTSDGTYVKETGGGSSSVLALTESRVGIGTTSPDYKVHVRENSSNNMATIGLQSDTPALALQVRGSSQAGIFGAGNGAVELVSIGNQNMVMGTYSGTGNLLLGTNSSERMRIVAGGNVGIGTTAPGFLADVVGDYTGGADASVPTLRVLNKNATQGNGTSTFNFSSLESAAGNSAVRTVLQSSYDSGSNYGAAGHLRVVTDHPMHIWTNNAKRVTVSNGGNVGIGTASPSGKLDVESSSNSEPVLEIKGTGTADLFNVMDNTTEVFTILDGGNVGIGTTGPSAKLEVDDQNRSSDGPLFLIDINSTNSSGVPPSTCMYGTQFKTNLSSTHDRFYIGNHNELIDRHVGFGDHVGHASHAYGYVNRDAGGGSTGGDIWAYYGMVSNRDGGGTGHNVNGIAMELNTINCEKDYSENLDDLDTVPTDFMFGLTIWPEAQSAYQNTRGIYIWADTNSTPYHGYDTAIHCMNFVNTGIYLNSANSGKTRLSGIRFGDDLDYDFIIHQKNTTYDYWGLANPSADYIVWKYDVRSSPKDILAMTNTGKVGIGTTSPDHKLSVQDPSNITQAIFGQDRTSDQSQITIGEQDTTSKGINIGYDHANNYGYMQISGDYIGTVLTISKGASAPAGGNVGIGTTSPQTKLHSTGDTILGAATSAESSGNMGNGEVNIWVDETNNKLKFQVKYSGGTVKNGEVSLT